MRSISIVSTQMQLCNAIELINQLHYNDNYLIVNAKTKFRDEKIKELLLSPAYKNFFARTYKTYVNTFLGRFFEDFYIKAIIFFLSKRKIFDVSIIGNMKFIEHRYVWYRSYLRNPQVSLFIVDDGIVMCSYPKIRTEEVLNHRISSDCVLSGRIISILYHSKSFRSFVPTSITFFTIFSLFIREDDRIKLNDYRYIRKHISDFGLDYKYDNKDIIVLGQPLVKMGLLTKDRYNQYLSYIYENFKPIDKLLYFAHPAEDENSSISEENRKKLIYLQNKLPFELIAMILSYNIKIVGFYTSVLANLYVIRPDFDVYCMYIDECEYISHSDFILVKNAFDYIRNSHIKVITINNII